MLIKISNWDDFLNVLNIEIVNFILYKLTK